MNRRLGAIAILIAAIAATAGLLASTSSGARTTQRTIGIVLPDPNGGAPLSDAIQPGFNAAASALGDKLEVIPADGAEAMTGAVKSLTAQHVAAIVVNTDRGSGAVTPVLPALAKARAAGIPTLSYEQPYPGSIWVTQSTPRQFAHALADALASQMRGRGQYVIVGCKPHTPIVPIWLKAVEAYVPHRYPRMRRVGVTYGDTGNGDVDTHMFRRLVTRHPHLRGMLFLCPGEAVIVPRQIIKAHEVGKVFSVGGDGLCPPIEADYYARSIQQGAEEIVCQGDPVKLGYLVVWAADYLAGGHTFGPGSYSVGGPVGAVKYDQPDMELPLGQPLTITKDNLAQYGGQNRVTQAAPRHERSNS